MLYIALRMFYSRDICIPVFVALNKIGVGQYEDSDSKPGVGVRGVQGFFFRDGFKWLLVISQGAFQALKQLIFH